MAWGWGGADGTAYRTLPRMARACGVMRAHPNRMARWLLLRTRVYVGARTSAICCLLFYSTYHDCVQIGARMQALQQRQSAGQRLSRSCGHLPIRVAMRKPLNVSAQASSGEILAQSTGSVLRAFLQLTSWVALPM